MRALVGIGLGALALVGASAAAPSVPRLALVDRSPVVLEGSGFDAHERVRLIVTAPSLRIDRVVRAGATGRFRTTIHKLDLTGQLRCAIGVTVVARSPGAGIVLWRRPRLPDCSAPLPIPA